MTVGGPGDADRTGRVPGAPLDFSVIVPCFNGRETLARALPAICASRFPRERWELIVVDDASDDGSEFIAAQYADTVIRLGGRSRGPAYARNRGAEMARGRILVFVDADVCVRPDTLCRFERAFEARPDAAAIVGAYDTASPVADLASQYRNLLRHFVHCRYAGVVGAFWGGCGAVRLQAFRSVGMYDEWHFQRRQIEDVELGDRLRERGYRILLEPAIQATHLKRWTPWSILASDGWERTALLARLFGGRRMARDGQPITLRTTGLQSAVLIGVAATLGVAAATTGGVMLALAALGVASAGVLLDAPFLALLARQRGWPFALAALPLHLAREMVTGAALVYGWMLRHTVGEPRPDPTTEALAEVGAKSWPPVPARR